MKCLGSTVRNALVALVVISWSVAQADDTVSAVKLDDKIQQLQKERVDVLEQATEAALAMYKQGVMGLDTVIDAQQELVEAKLDVAKTLEQKIAVVEEQLKIAKDYVKFIQARFDAGSTHAVDLLRGKSNALRVEVELLKLRRALAASEAPEE